MFLSMWISNTAATAMMVPIVDAIDNAINPSSDIENNVRGLDGCFVLVDKK